MPVSTPKVTMSQQRSSKKSRASVTATGTCCLLLLGLVSLRCGPKDEIIPFGDGDGDGDGDGTGGAMGGGGGMSSDCEIDLTLAERDAQELFDYDHVPTFEISLPEERWDYLLAHAVEEQWEPVEACFEGKSLGNIALRFKGSYGTLYSCFDESGALICPRLSMKLKFNEYDEDLRFFGLKRLNFHANRYDDSRMKERLAYDLFRAMDVPAPRAAWAVVSVNGKSLGLYGMVEEIDGRFTKDRWPDHPDGNLYKELWPTDTDENDITLSLRTNEDDPQIGGFVEMSEAVTTADDDAGVLTALGEFTDLDHWARYMAVDDAVAGYDGVTYFYTSDGSWSHNHNYYFYEDAPSHFTLVPWDVESTFWINPDHAAPHWTIRPEDCALTYDYWGGLATAPGCDPVFRALHLDLERWRAAAQELLDGPFAEATMLAAIDEHEAFIGEHARSGDTPTMYAPFDSATDTLRSTIPQLRQRLEALIDASQD
jgi:spore coat protein H